MKVFLTSWLTLLILLTITSFTFTKAQDLKPLSKTPIKLSTKPSKRIPIKSPTSSPIPFISPSAIPSPIFSPTPSLTPSPTPSQTNSPIPTPTTSQTPANSCLSDGVCKTNAPCTVSVVSGVNKISRTGECGFAPSQECYCESYPIDGCELANCSGKICMAAIFGRPYDGTCNRNGDTCSCIPGN